MKSKKPGIMRPEDIRMLIKDYEIDDIALASLLNVGARTVRQWKIGDAAPTASCEAIMVGLSETFRNCIVCDRAKLRNYVRSACAVGGLAYLIVRLFEGQKL